MAHFAKMGDDNLVIEVLVVDNDKLEDENGTEVEQVGIDFLTEVFDYPHWKQTSYNGNFRMNFAAPTFKYHEDIDAFVPPKPHSSWILDKFIGDWEAPIDYPEDGKEYFWDEEVQNWTAITEVEK